MSTKEKQAKPAVKQAAPAKKVTTTKTQAKPVETKKVAKVQPVKKAATPSKVTVKPLEVKADAKPAAKVQVKPVQTKPATNKQVSTIATNQLEEFQQPVRGNTDNGKQETTTKHVQQHVGKSYLSSLLLGH